MTDRGGSADGVALAEFGAFLEALRAALAARAGGDAPRDAAWRRVDAALAAPPQALRDRSPARQPACEHLAASIARLADAEPDVRRLGEAFAALDSRLDWAGPNERRATPELNVAYADVTLVGPRGLVPSDAVEIGVSLMAPNTTYPDHQHPPEEIYIALSHGEWRQEARPWHEPGIGGLVFNPAGIVHAMRSGPAPFLAVWCLPLP